MRGEVPEAPHSMEAEQAVLGSLLIDGKAWHRIAGQLDTDDFYRPEHRATFGAVRELCAGGKVADTLTVAELLDRRGELENVGGRAALIRLARETPSSANVAGYAAVVRERSMLRRLQGFASALARAVGEADGDAAEIASRAQEQLITIQGAGRRGAGLVSAKELAPGLIDDLDGARASPRLLLGLQDFDALTHGLEGGDLVVIAGRPGMGKTALLVTIAAHVAQSASVAVFSAEMPRRQLMRRALALVSSVPQGRLRAGQLTEAEWGAIGPATAQLAQRRLWIDDTSAPTMAHVRAECLGLKARVGLGLVLIDYVQLMQGQGGNRYEQLRDVAYGCKALAKDLGVPVILLAQLNRGVEARDYKRPYLSDLRDSGAIEEAADIVGLLYSEAYYDAEFGMPYVLECRIEKHRNGERGECLWHFNGAQSRITVLDDGARAQYRQMRVKQQRRGASDDL